MEDIFVKMQILFRMQSINKMFELKIKTYLLLIRNRNILLTDVLWNMNLLTIKYTSKNNNLTNNRSKTYVFKQNSHQMPRFHRREQIFILSTNLFFYSKKWLKHIITSSKAVWKTGFWLAILTRILMLVACWE